MLAYRIADRRRPVFDGTGAMLKGGRWNSPGNRVIYAAQTYAGAMLEILVHANLGIVPDTHAAVSIEIPENIAVERLDSSTAAGWDGEDLLASREFGDRWFKERRTSVLLVPSVVLQGRELNVVFNPEHADFGHVRSSVPEPVLWDPRLFPRPR